MTKSIEIEQADNGLITVVRDGPHKTTYVHTDFMSMKRYVNEQLRAFEPVERFTPEQLAARKAIANHVAAQAEA
jgi:hypothetical protein